MRVVSKTWLAPLGVCAPGTRHGEEQEAARPPLAAVPDRAEREAAAAEAREAYCARMKAARLRAGVDLGALAQATKVSASHFAALERADLSRWPVGIYRRSFLRAYIEAIGWPVDATLEEVLALFPEVETKALPAGSTALRLTLAGSSRKRYSVTHALGAAADMAAVLLASVAIAFMAGLGYWTTVAIVALAYFSISIALVGTSAATWWMGRAAAPSRKLRALPSATGLPSDREQTP